MPESPASPRSSPVNTEGKRSVFPSLRKWQDQWEADLDLTGLRAKKLSIDRLVRLLAMRQQTMDLPIRPVTTEQVEPLVGALHLSIDRAAQLKSDALLVGHWHSVPKIQRALHLGRSQHIAALQSTAKLARRLCVEIATDAVGIDELMGDLSIDVDMLELNLRLQTYVEQAKQAIDRLGVEHGGRRRDAHRNVTLALATQAVEAATDTRVEITTPSDGNPWRFTNAAGCFVRDFMQLLIDDNERILVGTLAKIRRVKA